MMTFDIDREISRAIDDVERLVAEVIEHDMPVLASGRETARCIELRSALARIMSLTGADLEPEPDEA